MNTPSPTLFTPIKSRAFDQREGLEHVGSELGEAVWALRLRASRLDKVRASIIRISYWAPLEYIIIIKNPIRNTIGNNVGFYIQAAWVL